MNEIFGEEKVRKNFQHEKRFLLCTLIIFSISYLVCVLRNLIEWMVLQPQISATQIDDYICQSNSSLTLFYAISYFVTDLLPYVCIFYLNWKNFRLIDKQDAYLQEQENRIISELSSRHLSTNGSSQRVTMIRVSNAGMPNQHTQSDAWPSTYRPSLNSSSGRGPADSL